MCGDSDSDSKDSTDERDAKSSLGPKQRGAAHPSLRNDPVFEDAISIDPVYTNTQNYLPSQAIDYGRDGGVQAIQPYDQNQQTYSEYQLNPRRGPGYMSESDRNYYNDPRNQRILREGETYTPYDPNGKTNKTTRTTTPPSDDKNNNNKPPQQVTAEENARRRAISARNSAINTKQAAINKAFTDKYTTDYYSGLRSSFNNQYLDNLQNAYDASMRGIWEGIRNKGVFNQTGFDTSKGTLDTAKTTETTTLDNLAKAYRDSQITAVGDAKSGILSGLSSLYGDNDVSAADAAAQQAAVEGYSYIADMPSTDITPDMGDTPTFFSGFNQAAARQAMPTATIRTGRTPQQQQQAGGLARTMVRSPVGSGSSTIIRG